MYPRGGLFLAVLYSFKSNSYLTKCYRSRNFFGKVVICCIPKVWISGKCILIIFVAVYSKKFVVPERGFLILFPQSLSPLAETVVYFFKVSS